MLIVNIQFVAEQVTCCRYVSELLMTQNKQSDKGMMAPK
jgi:hypothetical protein